MKKYLLLSFLIAGINAISQIDSTKFFKTNKGCKIYNVYLNDEADFDWNGDCENGLAQGKGVCKFSYEGKELGSLEGEFNQGVPEGDCVLDFLGTIYKCAYVDGRMYGIGTRTTENGDQYEGELKDLWMHGDGKMIYSNGSEFTGKFRLGNYWTGAFINLQDEQIYYQFEKEVEEIDKSYLESTYKPELNKVQTEYFDEYWNRCEKGEANFYRKISYQAQNIPVGIVKDFYISGSPYRNYKLRYVDYADDYMNIKDAGECTKYWESGNLKFIAYVNYYGEFQGPFENYHENGSLSEKGNYSSSKRDGPSVLLDEEGNITNYAFFEDGSNKGRYYDITDGIWTLRYEENFRENFTFWDNSEDYLNVDLLDESLYLNMSNNNFYRREKAIELYDVENQFKVFTNFRTLKSEFKKKDQIGLIFDYFDADNYGAVYVDNKQVAHVAQYISGVSNDLASFKLDKSFNKSDVLDFYMEVDFFYQGVLFVVNGELVHQLNNWDWRGNGRFGVFAQNGKNYVISSFGSAEYFNAESSEVFTNYVIAKVLNSSDSEYDSNGSGFLISKEGHIVTNYHVVEDANEIDVQFSINGETKVFPAKVIINDKINDLSIIKIDEDYTFNDIPYTIDFDIQDVGNQVFTMGYPMIDIMGTEVKYTDGKISSKTGIEGDIRTYQITAPIQPGNSGGPLFNSKTGSVIAIINATLNRDYAAENVNFALKTNLLKTLIDSAPEKINLPSEENAKWSELDETKGIEIYKSFIPAIMIKY